MDLTQIIGKSAALSRTVDEASTARAMRSGALPVFATPSLVALMEAAACACLAEQLAPGQTSVGTQINVFHTSASPVGALVTATAEVTAAEGRKIEFSVTACDEKGEIGHGTHTRAVVDEEKFMRRTSEKL
ncbi:MAG: thioesterase family protein [Oscillospiraceae bacterium]|jgi:predicted thioesterase|nr:thioesterase family protein [Oscillospiraceae bacterium]